MLRCTNIDEFAKRYKPIDHYGTLLHTLYDYNADTSDCADEYIVVEMAIDITSGEVSFWVSCEKRYPPTGYNIIDFSEEIPMDIVFKLLSEGLFEYIPEEVVEDE